MTYPSVPAAFINAIAEEGTKDEAITWLQKQWNETCALRRALREIVDEYRNHDAASVDVMFQIAHDALESK